jgi:serine/threonine-protein kinase
VAAHAARFRWLVRVAHRWADARVELDRMRALDPGDALWLPESEAQFAGVMGRLEEAIRIQRQIADRDPLNASAIGTLAFYLLHADRFEESAALFQQELVLNPHALGNHALVGVNLALLGKGDPAFEQIAQERHAGYRLWASGVAHAALGQRDEAEAVMKEIRKSPNVDAYALAQLHALRGDRHAAFEWLTRACTEGQGGCEMVKVDRFLRPLRDDARYRALLARMNLDS